MIDDQGFDARRLGAAQPLDAGAVGDDDRDGGAQPPGGDGVDERLEIAAAPGDEDADDAGRWSAAHQRV